MIRGIEGVLHEVNNSKQKQSQAQKTTERHWYEQVVDFLGYNYNYWEVNVTIYNIIEIIKSTQGRSRQVWTLEWSGLQCVCTYAIYVYELGGLGGCSPRTFGEFGGYQIASETPFQGQYDASGRPDNRVSHV